MLTQQPFSSVPYQYAATEFGDIAYRETGSGPASLFVHGVSLSGEHLNHGRRSTCPGIRRVTEPLRMQSSVGYPRQPSGETLGS